MEPDWNKIAATAYQAYGSVTDFKNYQGLPMPSFEQLPAQIKKAWIEACKAVARLEFSHDRG